VPNTKVLGETRAIAEAVARNAEAWADNDKPVHPATMRLWVDYGARVALAYIALRDHLVRDHLDQGYAEHEAEEIVDNLGCPS
jgi:hypothetical protein